MSIVACTIIAPLALAIAALLVHQRMQRALLVGGALVNAGLAVATFDLVHGEGIQVVRMGGWPAPLGIALAADLFAAIMVVLAGAIGVAVAIRAAQALNNDELESRAPALILVLLAGVNLAFLTADLFNLYVAFEVVLMASFVLMALSGGSERTLATARYLIPSVISSTLLLTGVALLYGEVGTLDMSDAARALAGREASPAVLSAAGALALAFLLKCAAFPFFAWLPASYPAAPGAIVALFAGLLTKVGLYALVRVFTLVLPGQLDTLSSLLTPIAAATMVVGVLGAVAQWNMQRLLSFHVVSQIGYLLVGLAIGTPLALAAMIYYVVHNSIAKVGLMLGADVVKASHRTDSLRRLGGIASSAPLLATMFLVSALSLAGIPPLSGFWAKLLVIQSGLETQSYVLVGVAVGVSVLTLLSMTKIWTNAFWGTPNDDVHVQPIPARALLSPGLLAALSIALGLGAGPAIEIAQSAAAQLLDPSTYIAALLGETP